MRMGLLIQDSSATCQTSDPEEQRKAENECGAPCLARSLIALCCDVCGVTHAKCAQVMHQATRQAWCVLAENVCVGIC